MLRLNNYPLFIPYQTPFRHEIPVSFLMPEHSTIVGVGGPNPHGYYSLYVREDDLLVKKKERFFRIRQTGACIHHRDEIIGTINCQCDTEGFKTNETFHVFEVYP